MTRDSDESIQADGTAPEDRLESWKEIAGYLGRGVTTVQRWEQEEGLPVHRLAHAKKGSVFAYKREIETWRRSRTLVAPDRPPSAAPLRGAAAGFDLERDQGRSPARGRRTLVLFVAGSLSILTIAAISVTWMGRRPESGTADRAARVEPRPIAGEPSSEGEASLSPDGSRVVYSRLFQGDTQLLVRPVLGGGPSVPLPTDPSASYSAWSPRGDLIAFLTWETENIRALHIVAPEGGEPRRLALIAGTWLCWTRDGRAIGFADRNSTTEPFAIVTLDLATGERRRLTTPPPGSFGDTGCAFSPDGRTLAVSRFSNRFQSDVFLSVFPETPDNPATRATTGFAAIEGLAWSPDGAAIVIGSSVGLWRVDARPLPNTPVLIAGAAMTMRAPSFGVPAGGAPRLAYEHVNRDVNLWRWTVGSTEPAAVPGWPGWDDQPALAPDGHRIAFASNRTGHNEIWIDSLEGGRAHRLTHHDGPLVISPRWSPDGTQVAFSSEVAGNRDIYVIGADGSASRRLTFEPSLDELPNWSLDGRWI
jgi:Tol biopolymer transport system component